MYEEDNKMKISWGKQILNLILLAIIIIILVIIFIKVIEPKRQDDSLNQGFYVNNIMNMKKVALDYFKDSKLPENVGKTNSLSLREMLEQKLLTDFTDHGKKCNLEDSYIQVTKTADLAYALKVNLVCNDYSDYIISSIEKEDCNVITETNNNNTNNSTQQNINNSNNNNKTNNKNNSSSKNNQKDVDIDIEVNCPNNKCDNNSNNNNNNNNEETPKKVLYYKYQKYSDWMPGYSNEANTENKKLEVNYTSYCKVNNGTIYYNNFITSIEPNNYKYTLRFTNFTASDLVYVDTGVLDEFINIKTSSYYSNDDYTNFLNLSTYGYQINNNSYQPMITSSWQFQEASLKSSNFTFTVSKPYKMNNNYYLDITLNVKNLDKVIPYYDYTLRKNIYLTPIKINYEYSLKRDCVTDYDENWFNHPNTLVANSWSKEEYQHRTISYTWSTKDKLDGWTYTGISEYR